MTPARSPALLQIPNALSGVRILAALMLPVWALLDSPVGFWLCLGTALASDVLDGWVARALGVSTELGRRLDSAGDYVTAGTLLPALWILWAERTRAALPWIAVIAVAYFLPTVISWLRWRIVPAYHTWAAKAAAATTSVALILVYAADSAVLLPAAGLMQILAATEELAIARLRPGWSGSVPSYWHARRTMRLR